MAFKTKAELKTEKDGFVDGGNAPAEQFRDYEENLLDSVYSKVIAPATDSNGTTDHMTVEAGLTLITYSITTWRYGNTCFVAGNLVVSFGGASGRTLATLKPEFETLVDVFIPINGIAAAIKIDDDGKIKTSTTIAAGSYVFNGAYPAAST